MIPPGLAFIALSERAEAELERADGPRYYFDLRSELACQPRGDTAFSTAVSLVVGLRESLRMILEEGLEAVFARHAWTAHAVRDAITALGLELFAPRAPSFATTAVRAPDGLDAGRLVARLRDAYGVTIAAGQGQAAGKIFRIGHLGWLDAFDMLTAIGALELALQDLGYPVKLGEGTRTLTERMRELPGFGS
jgi:aspartate aminotransferase-like enzyme